MKSDPLVSIILPVYNCERYVNRAIYSCLNQTYKNIELLIANDGSTDRTWEKLMKISDPRVKFYNNKNNGLGFTLNFLISRAKGEFIARMDGDDISDLNRIELQIEYLLRNPQYALLGTGSRLMKEDGGFFDHWHPPKDYYTCLAHLIFGPCFVHPSVIFNMRILTKTDIKYNPLLKTAEDYDLWVELALKGFKFINIDKPLLFYQISNNSMTSRLSDLIYDETKHARIKYLKGLGLDHLEKEIYSFYNINGNENKRYLLKILVHLFKGEKKNFKFLKASFLIILKKYGLIVIKKLR